MEDAEDEWFATDWAEVIKLSRLLRFQADIAGAMAVKVIFSFFREQVEGAAECGWGLCFQGLAYSQVARVAMEDGGVAAQVGRRMGVGIRDQGQAVEAADQAIHGNVRRQSGFGSKDFIGQVAETFCHGVKAGFGAEHGEPRRPNMSGNQPGVGRSVQDDIKQVSAVESKYGPPVCLEIADFSEGGVDGVNSIEVRREDQGVDFSGCSIALVNAADFDIEDEVNVLPTGGRDAGVDFGFQFRPQFQQAVASVNQLVLQFSDPGRVGEVAGGDDTDALALSPGAESFQAAFPAGGTGQMRMDMEVGKIGHGVARRCFTVPCCRNRW